MTREAVLGSAVEAFTRSGYDGARVREIAEGAGVSAMMVNRCSGSKENLFAEVVDTSFTPRTVVPDDLTRLSPRRGSGRGRTSTDSRVIWKACSPAC
ncbi:TetR/AcrR family transcriptional regulator [Streptomyces olivaceoviridis]|uniref:TetR/AcrR family transcriptional regulator n=1 Tax=Streptomyces olivaceoviridis TaxID=1921 RepID=UPI0036A518F3